MTPGQILSSHGLTGAQFREMNRQALAERRDSKTAAIVRLQQYAAEDAREAVERSNAGDAYGATCAQVRAAVAASLAREALGVR